MKRKFVPLSSLLKSIRRLKDQGKKIVFTNGCFDLIHLGHIKLLEKAKSFGDILVVGLNTDASVKKLKGPTRPLNPERDRAHVLAALEAVDYVVHFSEPTPYRLIQQIKPDVLVKGGDYKPSEVVGASVVRKNNGKIKIVPTIKGRGTTRIVQKIKKS